MLDMEKRPPKKPVRTSHSVLNNVPKQKHSREHKQVVMVVGVVMSMVVIAGLNASMMKRLDILGGGNDTRSRWTELKEDFVFDSKPFADELFSLKDTFTAILNAQKVQASSINIVKNKILSGTSTSETSKEDPASLETIQKDAETGDDTQYESEN